MYRRLQLRELCAGGCNEGTELEWGPSDVNERDWPQLYIFFSTTLRSWRFFTAQDFRFDPLPIKQLRKVLQPVQKCYQPLQSNQRQERVVHDHKTLARLNRARNPSSSFTEKGVQ